MHINFLQFVLLKWTVYIHVHASQKSVSEAKWVPQEIIYAVNNWWPKGQVYMYPQSLTSTPTGCTEVYK